MPAEPTHVQKTAAVLMEIASTPVFVMKATLDRPAKQVWNPLRRLTKS